MLLSDYVASPAVPFVDFYVGDVSRIQVGGPFLQSFGFQPSSVTSIDNLNFCSGFDVSTVPPHVLSSIDLGSEATDGLCVTCSFETFSINIGKEGEKGVDVPFTMLFVR